MKKHNILFIMTDQFRWDAMGCCGSGTKTPNLDYIASQGIRFSNCVTNSPVCVPARASLALGQYPHNLNLWQNIDYTLPMDCNTWTRSVKSAGYRMCVVGKTHLHPHSGDLREKEYLLNAYGFDDVDEIGGPRASAVILSHMTAEWEKQGLWEAYKEDYKQRFATKPFVARPSVLPLEYYSDVYVGKRAKRYLEGYNREQPLFMWLSFGGPHEPWDAPEPYASMYKPDDMQKPIKCFDFGDGRPKGRLDKLLENKRTDMTDDDVMGMRANYAGNVTLIDDQIGEIIKLLKDRGEWDNTVILFTSDHGEMNGDYGLIYKENFLNGSLRIPLLISTPEMRAEGRGGVVSGALVELMDIGPTLAEIAGNCLDYPQFGQSLCPLLQGNCASHRDFTLSEIHGEVCYMDASWKMALNCDGVPYMLFNIRDEPSETANIVSCPETADIKCLLTGRLMKHILQLY